MKKILILFLMLLTTGILIGCTADFRPDSFSAAVLPDPKNLEDATFYFGLTWDLE